jgi:predicted Zn-ribbon and HTH transcriptional regulator
MTDNPLAVRWDTEFEDDDIKKLLAEVGDDFAFALDRNGWMIVMKPECCDEPRLEEQKWPMNAPSDACPIWATEIAVNTNERRQIEFKPYP